MLRARLFLPLFAVLLVACSGDDGGAPTDGGADVDYGDGPITTRPDDGVDTEAPDTGTAGDAPPDTTTGDTASLDTAAGDTASADTASGDAPVAETGTDGGSPSAARIHEAYVDRAIEGDGVEYVEIRAPAGTPIGGLWLRVLDKTGTPYFNLRVADAGTNMKSSGYWVVGWEFADKSDKGYKLSEWGLPADGGSIQLVRYDGATPVLIDVVGYGTAPSATSTEPKKTLEGTAAALPSGGSTGKSIGRKSVPGDSDDNATDFCVMSSTPGAANGACL
ncbi:MAG: hypothetical protein HYV09_14090 [Deltaproteobacteria bacterium]|nr:hypothetical protein [Deltaproteobacteria bacterium]